MIHITNKEHKHMRYTIGIDFHDNDFYTVFKWFLENIVDRLEFKPTKEQLALIWNGTIGGIYLAFQNKFEYGDIRQYEFLYNAYLKLDSSSFLIDNEVYEFINDNTRFFNGEFFYLDKGEFRCLQQTGEI